MTKKARQKIIEIGAELVYRQGFNFTGLSQILSAAEVPKGSFYHYFGSKEEFGLEIIKYHTARLAQIAGQFFKDQGLSPLERIRAFFAELCKRTREGEYTCGCPIGNLTQEMSDLSPAFRERLFETVSQIKQVLAGQIALAQEAGEIDPDSEPTDLALYLISSYQGALLMKKVCLDSDPLQVFMDVTLGSALAGAKPGD